MSINSFFAEQYGITARNPFYSGVRITEGYDQKAFRLWMSPMRG